MKYKKALLINIGEGSLDKPYWDKLSELAEQVVHIAKDDSTTMQPNACVERLHSYDADVLTMVNVAKTTPGVKQWLGEVLE